MRTRLQIVKKQPRIRLYIHTSTEAEQHIIISELEVLLKRLKRSLEVKVT